MGMEVHQVFGTWSGSVRTDDGRIVVFDELAGLRRGVPRPVVSGTLTVASWNVLAAPWAAPAFYPAEMDPSLLDRVTRRELVAARLAELDADVVCLQETTPVDLLAIVDALGADVAMHAAPNAPELWASWSTEELPWEANGTAVLWRRDRFDAWRRARSR